MTLADVTLAAVTLAAATLAAVALAAEALAAVASGAAPLQGSPAAPSLALASIPGPPGQPIFVDGQLVGDIVVLHGPADALRAFKSFEVGARWRPAVTKHFLEDCCLETMEHLLSHFKSDEDQQDFRNIKDANGQKIQAVNRSKVPQFIDRCKRAG